MSGSALGYKAQPAFAIRFAPCSCRAPPWDTSDKNTLKSKLLSYFYLKYPGWALAYPRQLGAGELGDDAAGADRGAQDHSAAVSV